MDNYYLLSGYFSESFYSNSVSILSFDKVEIKHFFLASIVLSRTSEEQATNCQKSLASELQKHHATITPPASVVF